jgi:hypothetical protein
MTRLGSSSPPDAERRWSYCTNHGYVLACLARRPDVRLREVARLVGITERAAQKIVGDLEAAGAVLRIRVGRCNHYRIDPSQDLRHPLAMHRTVGDFLALLDGRPADDRVG